jgi:hypothetical protein
MTTSIADLFQARLDELKAKDLECQAKTKATLASIKSLVKELEAMDFEVSEL